MTRKKRMWSLHFPTYTKMGEMRPKTVRRVEIDTHVQTICVNKKHEIALSFSHRKCFFSFKIKKKRATQFEKWKKKKKKCVTFLLSLCVLCSRNELIIFFLNFMMIEMIKTHARTHKTKKEGRWWWITFFSFETTFKTKQ